MYDKDIEALSALYEKKSFCASAEALGIKESSLKSRIEALEKRYRIRILLGINEGDALFSPAGASLAEDARFIMRYAKTALENAGRLEREYDESVKIGSAFMAPEKEIYSLLEKRGEDLKDIRIRTAHFFSSEDALKGLGRDADILATLFDERMLKKHSLGQIELRREKLMLALSSSSDLIDVPMLDIEDLYGKKIYIYRKGYLKAFDQLRSDIAEYHKEIEAVSYESINAELEIKIEEEGSFLATFRPFENSLSRLALKPVLWNYSSSFGIIYKNTLSKNASLVIEKIRENMENS